MSVFDILKGVTILVRATYQIAMAIRESENLNNELKMTAGHLLNKLGVVGNLLDQIERFADRASEADAKTLIGHITSLRSLLEEAHSVLVEVQRNRNFFQRLFMKKDYFRQKMEETSKNIQEIMVLIQGTFPITPKVSLQCLEFPDFRKTFRNVPDKQLSFYDFSIVRDTPQLVFAITFDKFDTNCMCHMKVGNEQFIISYQLRTWSALNPKPIILAQRRREFGASWRLKNKISSSGSTPNLHSNPSTQPEAAASPSPPAVIENPHHTLDFSEFWMSHDDICGMTFTQSVLYIATKFEIAIVLISKQQLVAQYGAEGNGPNTFKHISHLYIPPEDQTNLYIVDRGQIAVHQYKINDSGLCFEYVRRCIVIADVPQPYNLVSCAIYNRHLYVSDDANNCLHIFPLNGQRQSHYVADNKMTPFIPGPLCAHGQYLYVANCSLESPGILVFNDECKPVDWFRSGLLTEILAIDIDPHINELYILTKTRTNEDGNEKKRPLIVSMNLIIRPQQ